MGKPDAHTVFPKYIFCSAHNDNVSALLRAFDSEKYKFTSATVASSVYVEFSEDKATKQQNVNIYYNSKTRDFSNREPILIDGVNQAEDGTMSAADFRNWLEDTLAGWTAYFLQNKTLSEWCDGEFTYNAEDYADW